MDSLVNISNKKPKKISLNQEENQQTPLNASSDATVAAGEALHTV